MHASPEVRFARSNFKGAGMARSRLQGYFFGLFSALINGKSDQENAELSYVAKKSILTDGEMRFMRSLDSAVEERYRVFPMVRIADIIGSDAGGRTESAFNRISSKHVDFVLADRATFATRGVVELDDSLQLRTDRRERDRLVDSVFDAAGIPVVRVRALPDYEVLSLRATIGAALRGGAS